MPYGTHYNMIDRSVAEDVTDIIYQITPEDRPLMSMASEGAAANIRHEWQTRALSTRNANIQVEGAAFAFTTDNTLTTREFNYTQILKKEVRVSGSNDASNHYAIDSVFTDQMSISLAEIGTDTEHAVINGTLASGTSGVGRSMIGIIDAVVANTTTTTLVSLVTMDETPFNDFIQVCWDEGGEPRDVLVGGAMKRRISSYTAGGTKYIASDQQRAVNTISMYESDFFPVTIHLSRDIPRAGDGYSSRISGFDVLFTDRTMLKLDYLRRFSSMETPEIADSRDGVILGELTLEWGNAGGHFVAQQVT